MSSIIRFSGYLVDKDTCNPISTDFSKYINAYGNLIGHKVILQQFHMEENANIDTTDELDENCDLSLLARHFKSTPTEQSYDRPIPAEGQVYKHFKLGKLVTVIGVGRHTETEELTVIYKHEDIIWVRPLAMFMSEVDRNKYPNAEQKYRFELVQEA